MRFHILYVFILIQIQGQLITQYSGPGSYSYFQADYEYNGNIDDLEHITCDQYITSFVNSSNPINYYAIQINKAMKDNYIELTTCCSPDACSDNTELLAKYEEMGGSNNYDDWCASHCAEDLSLDTVLYTFNFKKNRLQLQDYNDDNKIDNYNCFNAEKSSVNVTSYDEGVYVIAVTGFDQKYNEQNNAYLLQLNCLEIKSHRENKIKIPVTLPVSIDILLIAVTCLLVFGSILLFYFCQVKKKYKKHKKKKNEKQKTQTRENNAMSKVIRHHAPNKSKITILNTFEYENARDKSPVPDTEAKVELNHENANDQTPVTETEAKDELNYKVTETEEKYEKQSSSPEINLSVPIVMQDIKEKGIEQGVKVKLKWKTWTQIKDEFQPIWAVHFRQKRDMDNQEQWETINFEGIEIEIVNNKKFEVEISIPAGFNDPYEYQIALKMSGVGAEIKSNVVAYVPTIRIWFPGKLKDKIKSAKDKINAEVGMILEWELSAELQDANHGDDIINGCTIKFQKENIDPGQWEKVDAKIIKHTNPNLAKQRRFIAYLNGNFEDSKNNYFVVELKCKQELEEKWKNSLIRSNIVRFPLIEAQVRYIDPYTAIDDQLLKIDDQLNEWEDRTDLVLSHCIACAEDDDGFDIYQVVALRWFDKQSQRLSKHRPLESIGKEEFIIWGFSAVHQSIFTMILILLLQTSGLLIVIYKLISGVYDEVTASDENGFIQQCGMNVDRWRSVYSLKFLALLWSLIITINIGAALSHVQHSGLYKIMYVLTFKEQVRLQYLLHDPISLWFLQLGQLVNYFALLMAVVGSYFIIFIERFNTDYYLTGIDLILNAVALFFILELDDFVVTHQDYIDCKRILSNKARDFLQAGKSKAKTFHKNHSKVMKYIFYTISVIGVIGKSLCYVQGLIAPVVIFFCW